MSSGRRPLRRAVSVSLGLVAAALSAAALTGCASTTSPRASARLVATTAATTASTAATITAKPYSLTYNPELIAIDCPTTTMCAAVGRSAVAVLAGGHWAIKSTPPLPNNPDVQLEAVSCPTAKWCLAVGYANVEREYHNQPVLETWDGHRWTLSMLNTFGAEGRLTDVSCTSAGACVLIGATGTPAPTAPPVYPVVGQLAKGQWHRIPLPAKSPLRQSILSAISCTSSTHCAMTALSAQNGSDVGVLASIWNGKSWTTTAFPQFATDGAMKLRCSAANNCTAMASSSLVPPMLLTWNGSRWSSSTYRINGPTPQDQTSPYLAGCWRDSGCVAISATTVGGTGNSGGHFAPLALHLNGGVATSKFLPFPTSKTGGHIYAASCPAPANCYAIGDASTSAGDNFYTVHWPKAS